MTRGELIRAVVLFVLLAILTLFAQQLPFLAPPPLWYVECGPPGNLRGFDTREEAEALAKEHLDQVGRGSACVVSFESWD